MAKYEKSRQIRDLKRDDIVNDIFVVKFKKPVEPYRNGFKFELRLADSSQEIMYKYWGPAEETKVRLVYSMIKPGDVVLVQGRVSEWNDKLEISANEQSAIKILKKDEYDVSDFVRKTTKQVEQMYRELMQHVDSIQNAEIKKVLEHFFKGKEFSEKFRHSPAAMYIHHGWVGGLLEHTLSVVQICEAILKLHEMDRDILIAGAILHDIGKIEEFEVSTSIDVTTKGVLVGHVTIAIEMLTRAMDALQTSEKLRWKIIHMVMTHMGEYGSSKQPAFPEALAVFYADQLDAKLLQMREFKESAQTEDVYLYHKEFGNIYLE